MNRWEIYEALRRGSNLNIHELEETDLLEIKEGLIEYMLMKEVEHAVKPYKNRIAIAKDELINLYIKQNLTTEQIAVLKKCSSNHVYSELKRQKVFTKKNSLQITLLKNINKNENIIT